MDLSRAFHVISSTAASAVIAACLLNPAASLAEEYPFDGISGEPAVFEPQYSGASEDEPQADPSSTAPEEEDEAETPETDAPADPGLSDEEPPVDVPDDSEGNDVPAADTDQNASSEDPSEPEESEDPSAPDDSPSTPDSNQGFDAADSPGHTDKAEDDAKTDADKTDGKSEDGKESTDKAETQAETLVDIEEVAFAFILSNNWDDTFVRTGFPVKAPVLVFPLTDIPSLEEGTDYELVYSNNVEIGTAQVEVRGKGRYNGAIKLQFTIVAPRVARAFDDVWRGSWYYNYVRVAEQRGIMTGYANSNLFGPEDTLTRAMVAVMIYRSATGNSGSGGTVSHFTDVETGVWYTAAIEWCRQQGIVTGYEGTTLFGPDDPVTREQFAVMLYRWLGGNTKTPTFPDSGLISGYAYEAMGWAQANGVLSGDGVTGEARPQGHATRAEAAKMFCVAIDEIFDLGSVISKAQQLIGTQYSTLDCSGLTSSAYFASIPHQSYQQYLMVVETGSFTSDLSELSPGDLVFYSRDGGATTYHVALYIGGGQIIDSVPNGGVQIRWVNSTSGAFGGGSPV